MGLKISKRYAYALHPMSAKLYEDITYHGVKVITFLANRASFFNFVGHCEFLHVGQWKNRKKCNILKRADRRVK